MPHFYFRLRSVDGEPEMEDLELPDVEAARREAWQACTDLLREEGKFDGHVRWEMEVTDGTGSRVAFLSFAAET